jgi:hypothetical protein
MLLRTGDMPSSGGITATVLLVSDLTDWIHGTGHGGIVPTAEAQRWTDTQTRYYHLVQGPGRRLELYLSRQRCPTEAQRLALAARDRGCSFPGCDAPAQRCQAHHVIEHQDGGPTSRWAGSHRQQRHTSRRWNGTTTVRSGEADQLPPPWRTRYVA